MGLREKIKSRVKKVIDTLSGEFSTEAPKDTIPYQRGESDQNAKVVMAKLNRPKGTGQGDNKPSS
jgi:hypothetical protein